MSRCAEGPENPAFAFAWLALFAFGAIVFWLFITVVVPLFGITLRSFVVTWGEGVKLSNVSLHSITTQTQV